MIGKPAMEPLILAQKDNSSFVREIVEYALRAINGTNPPPMSFGNIFENESIDEWHSLGLYFEQIAQHYDDMADYTNATKYYEKSNKCYERAIELNGGDINHPSGVDIEHNIVFVREKLQLHHRLTEIINAIAEKRRPTLLEN